MFHGPLEEAVRWADPTTEADPVGVYASLLAGAGALIGPGVYVQIASARHPLLIWPLLFGRTGSGRKGEATDTAEMFLLSSSMDYRSIRESGLSSGEGLIERIRDLDGKGGTADKRLLVVETEFSTVMARARREGSTLAGVLRDAWAGRALSVLNREQLKASSSYVAIIGHITPKEFRRRMADSEMAGGTYNRFLPLWVERSKRLPVAISLDDRAIKTIGSTIGKAIANAPAGEVTLSPTAEQRWSDALYDELTAGDDEDQEWTEFTRRAAPYCRRIAALTAVLDGSSVVHDEHLIAAGALVRYSVASAKYVLDQQARDPRLDRIQRAISSSPSKRLTRTEISGLFSRNLSSEQLRDLLDQLVASGKCERIEIKTGGRPAEGYRLRDTKKEETSRIRTFPLTEPDGTPRHWSESA